jgi:hypothetical protein
VSRSEAIREVPREYSAWRDRPTDDETPIGAADSGLTLGAVSDCE